MAIGEGAVAKPRDRERDGIPRSEKVYGDLRPWARESEVGGLACSKAANSGYWRCLRLTMPFLTCSSLPVLY